MEEDIINMEYRKTNREKAHEPTKQKFWCKFCDACQVGEWGKCKVCGKNAQSEYCFLHKPKKQLQQRVFPTSNKGVGKFTQKSSLLHKKLDKTLPNITKT